MDMSAVDHNDDSIYKITEPHIFSWLPWLQAWHTIVFVHPHNQASKRRRPQMRSCRELQWNA